MRNLGTGLPRAFLSHSSRDAELVRAVAAGIGRPFVRLDYFNFSTGDEFLAAIDQALSESALFVLFASRHSLQSLWVDAEVDAARYELKLGRLRKCLVCIMDDTLQAADLPSWLRRFKYVRSRAARPIARVVRGEIDDLMRERQHEFFVNRTRETEALQEVIAPSSGANPPTAFAVVGLDGMGRRTLLERISKDLLSLPRLLQINVESGDSASDLAVKIADLTEPAGAPDDAIAMAAEIEALDPGDAVARAIEDLRGAVALGELPTLVDRGGLLDNEGRLTDAVESLLSRSGDELDAPIAIISPRRPHFADRTPVPMVRVAELADSYVRRLLGLLARARSLELSPDQIGELAGLTRGYPPSARYSIDLAEHYGVSVASSDAQRAIEYRVRPFRSYLRSLILSADARTLLRILASNSPLPLEVLGQVVAAEPVVATEALVQLIDSSLVVPTSAGWYRAVDPIVDTVQRELGGCSRLEYSTVAEALERFLAQAGDELALLELARVRYRALVQAGGDTEQRFAYALASDWIKAAKDLYHRREYERSETVARAALEARPDNADVRAYLARALIKQGQHDAASAEIQELRRRGEGEDAAFLEGFLARHRGRFRDAVAAYSASRNMGRRGVALDRELANCYLELGELALAKQHIEAARSRQEDNPFIIDLRIRIACYEDDEPTARSLIELLGQVDDPAFLEFRKSRVELYFGQPDDVLAGARRAIAASTGRPSFEIQAQLVLALALTGNVDEGQDALERLQTMYPLRGRDVQLGLECRLQIARGRFDDALATLERIEDRDRPVHLRLRRDALQGLLDNTYLPASRRRDLQDEVTRLDSRLGVLGMGSTQDLVGGITAEI